MKTCQNRHGYCKLKQLSISIAKPYLEGQSIRSALEQVALATLSQIFVDYQDKLRAVSDMSDSSYYIYDAKIFKRNASGEVSTVDSNNQIVMCPVSKISPDNAFTMSKPTLRKAIATDVSLQVVEYKFEALYIEGQGSNDPKVLDTYYFSDEEYKLDEAGSNRIYRLYVTKYTKYIDLKIEIKDTADYEVLNDRKAVLADNKIFYEVAIPNNNVNLNSEATISGVPIESSSTDLSLRNQSSIENRTYLSYSAGNMVNESQAKQVALRLIDLYQDGRDMFSSEWIGDTSLDVGNSLVAKLPSVTADERKYMTVQSDIKFDGALRQNIKSISYKK